MTFDLLGDRRHGAILVEDPAADPPDDLRAFLTVSRAHPDDIGERQVFVRLDEGARVALLFGESFTDEIRPGTHRLRVHNTLFWKHLSFSVEPGEHLEFVVINSGRWWTYGVASILGCAPLFLRVEKRSLV